MRLTTKTLAVFAGLLAAVPAFAQGTGRSLDIQPGARQNGMGAAGVALGGDATGVTWWNPAGLGFIQNPAIQITSAQLVPGLADDVTYNNLAYVHPVEGWGAFGLQLAFLNYGTSEGVDTGGNSTGSFSSYEISSGLSYGTRLLPDFAVGAALKWIRIQLAPSALEGVGSTFGLDLAALYQIPAARLRFGLNIQNLGPSVTFINEDQASPLSRNLKIGTAWDALAGKSFQATVVGDYNQSLLPDNEDFRTYHGGLELRYGSDGDGKGALGNIGIAGRIGYYSDPLGEIEDLTYGVGFNWSKLALDYASIPQAKDSGLPNVNKISLGYRF